MQKQILSLNCFKLQNTFCTQGWSFYTCMAFIVNYLLNDLEFAMFSNYLNLKFRNTGWKLTPDASYFILNIIFQLSLQKLDICRLQDTYEFLLWDKPWVCRCCICWEVCIQCGLLSWFCFMFKMTINGGIQILFSAGISLKLTKYVHNCSQ